MDHNDDAMDVDFFAPSRANPLAEEAFTIQRETRKRLWGDMEAEPHPTQPPLLAPSAPLASTAANAKPSRKMFSNPFAKLFKKNQGMMPHADSGTAVQADLLVQIAQQYPTLFQLYCHDQYVRLTQEKLRAVANQQLRALNFEPVALVDATQVSERQKRTKTRTNQPREPRAVFAFNFFANRHGPTQMALPERGMCPPEMHARTIHELFARGPVVASKHFPLPIGPSARLPLIINELVGALLHPRALATEGLFRKAGPGNESALASWVASIGDPRGVVSMLSVSPHDFAVTLKRWLASGETEEDRLFPVAHSCAVESIMVKYTSNQVDATSTSLALRAAVQCLDAEHHCVLAAVILVARAVMNNYSYTRMDAENLARMFAPNVFAFRGPMTVPGVAWAAAALNMMFSEPNLAFWFTPISYEPFLVQPYLAQQHV